MSWFKTLFHTAESDVEKLANHVEAEYAALKADVEALKAKIEGTAVPAPAPATEPPPAA
jgi:hypothetical protein